MKIETSELTGAALDWAVAVALGHEVKVRNWQDITAHLYPAHDADLIAHHRERKTVRVSARQMPGWGMWPNPSYSTNWAQGGPIIEREEIGTKRNAPCTKGREWEASPSVTAKGAGGKFGYGPTPLIAAMRCFVASKLGDEVDVPVELL